MQVLVDIQDSQAAFGLKVLESLSFVKKAKPFSKSAIEIMKDLTEAAEEVKAHKAGKLKLKTAKVLLNEL